MTNVCGFRGDAWREAAVKICMISSLAVFLPGCASLTGSEIQNLSLTVSDGKSQPVKEAQCTLKNDKGTWQAKAPGIVDVRRSSEDLLVECRNEGMPNGILRAISRAAGGMFGNIIFGGGIGAIIDHNKGTGYNYPDNLPVVMGQSVVVDRAKQDEVANNETPASANDPNPVAGSPK